MDSSILQNWREEPEPDSLHPVFTSRSYTLRWKKLVVARPAFSVFDSGGTRVMICRGPYSLFVESIDFELATSKQQVLSANVPHAILLRRRYLVRDPLTAKEIGQIHPQGWMMFRAIQSWITDVQAGQRAYAQVESGSSCLTNLLPMGRSAVQRTIYLSSGRAAARLTVDDGPINYQMIVDINTTPEQFDPRLILAQASLCAFQDCHNREAME